MGNNRGLKALERLLQGLVGENNPYRQYLNGVPVIMEDYELVKKDLEVLDIIKKCKLNINDFIMYYDIDNKPVFTSFDAITKKVTDIGIIDIGSKLTQEEYEKIKEWLERK